MSPLPSSKRARASAVAALTFAGALCAFFAMGSEPAFALCKYGTPHCVNPNPGPKLPKVGGAEIPPSGWEDPDCKYYNNCGYVGSAVRGTPTGPQSTVPLSKKPVMLAQPD
jgi:hypothetical protein